ncbi:hypothetical protein CFC21_054837 [Triticum aestivum]|uniref:Disease resistance R13L4/SHOC-2-like LRR domain-containing protein n=2 Tax=Triticum aestivum TaxID=4565 RepID=A0A3B6I482_WHEAT|nr:hypothetical protein CFC21_054837 [Triticum aestivum]
MSEQDSKLLFRKTAHSEVSFPNYLEEEVLRKCAGIPLFISGMADWLREQKEEQLKLPTMLKQFERSLSPAYDDLPHWLKVQLLYVAMFPQGYIFAKSSFTKRLDAEMLTYPSCTEEDYFGELIDRNIITRVKSSSKQSRQAEEEGCHWQVNYFMLHFLASKSAANGFVYTSGTLKNSGDNKPRRLSLHEPDLQLPSLLEEMNLSYTRSLVVSGVVSGIPLDKLIFLKVLDLEGWCCFEEQHWLAICKLFLLRYLSLRKTLVRKLPPKIKDLYKLETLDLSHTQITELPSQMCELAGLRMLDLRGTPVMRLPKQFQKMRQLRHLLLGGNGVDNPNTTVTQVPEEIRYLCDLDTLAVDLSGCSPSLLEALGSIWKLRVLAINCSFHQSTDRKFQETLCSCIEKWEQLEALTIHCEPGCHMEFLSSDILVQTRWLMKFKVTGGRFLNFPRWLSKLDCLAFIEITIEKILQDDLTILGKMRRLECLVLGLHLLPEEAVVIDGEPLFLGLQRLSVRWRVPWMTFMKGAMPMLTHLELKNIGGSPLSEQCVSSGIINLQ